MRDQNFFVSKFPTSIFEKYFLENIFSKIEKSKIKNYQISHFLSKIRNFRFFIFSQFLIFRFFDFWKKYFPKKVFENRPTKNMDKKVFISHFFQRKDFFMNPKAKVAACSLLSKTSKNSSNGPKLAKWFPKNRRWAV